jgi:hypothetical protein
MLSCIVLAITLTDKIVIPIKAKDMDRAYTIINNNGFTPPAAKESITNSSSCANPSIKAEIVYNNNKFCFW